MIKNLITASLLMASTTCFAANISFDQMSEDINYLASDDLRGRANFSSEISVAANYIAKRFEDIGLSPLTGNNGFKQTFSLNNITPKSLAVEINGRQLSQAQLSMASTYDKFHWNSKEDTNIHIIDVEGDMRKTLRKLNQQGGNHLVIINPAHEKLFVRYQHYFSEGLNKLALEHRGAIVLALLDTPNVEKINVSGQTEITKKSLENVVGILPGKSKADEFVLFSAHYDHLGVDPKSGKDTIFNGADDDASGTSAVINLAEYYAKQANNERTIIFTAFTAEEIGGFGSQYFSKQLNPEQVKAMVNIEMIGKPSKFGKGKIWMTGYERSNLSKLLNNALKDKGIEIYADPYPKQDLFYRSDNATLARLGVPAHSFSTTQLDKDKHYHQVSDDLASLDLQSMHQAIETLAIATQPLVTGKITPNRIDKKAVRSKGKIY